MPSQWGIQWLAIMSCFKAPNYSLCFQRFMAHVWEENNLACSDKEAQQNVYNIQYSVALGREV